MIELFVTALLAAVIFIFVRISQRLRYGGGSMSTILSGATDAFLNQDKKKAVIEIAEIKSEKKLEEQKSGEPEEK